MPSARFLQVVFQCPEGYWGRRDALIANPVKAGGKIQPAEPDERALRLVDMVRPKLVQDGMYLVGLDIVGDRLMEINLKGPYFLTQLAARWMIRQKETGM